MVIECIFVDCGTIFDMDWIVVGVIVSWDSVDTTVYGIVLISVEPVTNFGGGNTVVVGAFVCMSLESLLLSVNPCTASISAVFKNDGKESCCTFTSPYSKHIITTFRKYN